MSQIVVPDIADAPIKIRVEKVILNPRTLTGAFKATQPMNFCPQADSEVDVYCFEFIAVRSNELGNHIFSTSQSKALKPGKPEIGSL